MKELVKFSEHIYCLQLSTNIGILVSRNKNGEDELHLIDSGNSEKKKKKILSVLKEHFPSGKLKTIINTHSHADHCGGNFFLKKMTGCEIMASQGEAPLMECPDLEIGLICGSAPVSQLKTPYFIAPVCPADKTFSNSQTIYLEKLKIEAISLKGHYIDQTGFLVTDTDGKRVFFAGDALSGRNVISRYWIQYLFDEEQTKKSLEKILTIKAEHYVPGHGLPVESVEGLVELNLLALLETENLIIEETKVPKTQEELLKALADRNDISLKLSQYMLIGCTLRSYLYSLSNQGKITFEIKDNIMKWKAK